MAGNIKKNTRENMANKLREARLQAGMTAREVGEIIGKSDKTIHAWENMHGQPDAEMLVKLCETYGVGIQYFFTDDLPDPDHTEEESRLLQRFGRLSVEGQGKVLAYIEDLIDAEERRREREHENK